MAIDFTLTKEQQDLQMMARTFAQDVLAPVAPKADAEPDPLRASTSPSRPTRRRASAGIAFSMLPKEYGGGGLSNVDFVIAAEEICAVDAGFATTVLVNGLGLMPVWYWGTEEQKQRFIATATADTSDEFIVGYAASEPPGTPGGTANFDAPAVGGAGMAVTATLDGDEYVINGRKYWPCNVGGWDNQGAELQPRRRAAPIPRPAARARCRRSSSSAARRGSPTSRSAPRASGSRPTARSRSTTRACRRRT